MATFDPIDLYTVTQGISHDFYRFHKQSDVFWYIKDAEHQFVDASNAFCSLFLPASTLDSHDYTDIQLFPASAAKVQLMQDYEKEVLSLKRSIHLFTWRYYMTKGELTGGIVKIQPFSQNHTISYFTKISDAFEILNWSDLILSDERPDKDIPFDLTYFNGSSPYDFLTERDWEVAWLVAIGKSQRWIASYFDIKHQAVDRKLNSVYMKLRVFDKDGFLTLVKAHGWLNYVPSSIHPQACIYKVM